eukprot:gene9673-12271_t
MSLFPRLFEECHNKRFTIHGLNVFQLAVTNGSYLSVRYCLMTGLFKAEDVYANGINALHLAIQRDHRAVVMCLLPLIGNVSHSEPDHFAMLSYRDDFYDWGAEQLVNDTVAEMKFMLSSGGISPKSMSYFLDQFANEISKLIQK